MNANAGVRKLKGKFWSIKSRSGGEGRRVKALELIPTIVIPKEIFGFRSKDFLMITVIATCLIAPLLVTIVVWLTVY